MSAEVKKVAVFGCGPSALSAANRLSDLGEEVTLIKPSDKEHENRSVFSTTVGYPGLAVNEFCPAPFRKNVDGLRVLTSRGTDFSTNLGDGYFMVDYPGVISYSLNRLGETDTHLESVPRRELKNIGVSQKNGVVEVKIDGGKSEFDYVVDGTGVPARIARSLDNTRSTENPLVEYVCGGWFPGHLDKDEIILIFGPSAGTSWLNNSVYKGKKGEDGLDIVYSAWGWESDFPKFVSQGERRLAILADFCLGKEGIHVTDTLPQTTFNGMIRSQPLQSIRTDVLYPVGEAAAIAKPGSGESFNRSVASGVMVADAIHADESPESVGRNFNQFLRRGDSLFYSSTLARLNHQRTGEIGKAMDDIGNMFTRQGGVKPDAVKIIEDFVIRGKISPKLIINLLSRSPNFRNFMMQSVLNQAKMNLIGEYFVKPEWCLPEI